MCVPLLECLVAALLHGPFVLFLCRTVEKKVEKQKGRPSVSGGDKKRGRSGWRNNRQDQTDDADANANANANDDDSDSDDEDGGQHLPGPTVRVVLEKVF